jgi:putative ABC transport system permease protein
MGNLRFKILRDLWTNWPRTLQVILIIGIGSAAIGMIMGTRNLVVPGMQRIWTTMDPAMINFFISPPITENELLNLNHIEGVKEVEGFNNANIEWRLNTDGEWKVGTITARSDYRDQNMNKLDLLEGDWPKEKIVANGQDFQVFGIPQNGEIEFRIDNKIYKIQLEGKIYDQLVQPATFGGTAQFYVSQDYYEYLEGDKDFSRVMVKADYWDEDHVTAIADSIDDRLKKMGHESGRFITDPNKHFFQDTMDGIFFMMGAFGVLALILGLLLVYNTINSIIASQTDQIGVMKAIGARTGQILRFYLLVVLIYGLLSLALSLPLGIMGAWAVSRWLAGNFGADLGSFELDRQAIIIQSSLAVLAPMLAALVPIISAARVTVREAISTYGLSADAGLMERILSKLKFISRLVIVTISNTFQHKGRVILLQIALVLSALVFMMVVSVRDSVSYTVKDVLFKILNTNITMLFEEPERIDHIEPLTMAFPGIKAVEMWGLSSATMRPKGQEYSKDDESTQVMGVPLPTDLYGYQLRGGRWLDPHDTAAIVLNTKLAEDVGVKVGDWVTVRYEEKKERDFQVVGLIFDPVLTNFSLINRQVLLKDIGSVDRAQSVWIQTDQSGVQFEEATAKALRQYYSDNNIKVSAQRGIFGLGSDSTTATGNTFVNQFNFLVVLLGIMSVVIAIVGSIALSGALSLSVLERRREIGVMRAIGASSWSIFRLFIGEGLILGWMSWILALPFLIPAGKGMAQALGAAFQLDIVYKFEPTGAIMWLVIITILSILASWLPARGATKISVRESLAYQ